MGTPSATLQSMALDIRDESSGDSIELRLYIEGLSWATARAGVDEVSLMQAQLGRRRQDIAQDLRGALERLHANQLEKVAIASLKEDPVGSRRFVASYLYRDHRELTGGIVWYNVATGVTGPEFVPALVRNKLRYAVHQDLVKGNAAAEELLKAVR